MFVLFRKLWSLIVKWLGRHKVIKAHVAAIPLIFVTSLIFYLLTKALRWRWEGSTHAEVNKADARVWAHSWAGAMVTDNAAPNDRRRMNRLPCPTLGGSYAPTRTAHAPQLLRKCPLCLARRVYRFRQHQERKCQKKQSDRGVFKTCRSPLNCERLQDRLRNPDCPRH